MVGDGRTLTVGGREASLTLARLVQDPIAVSGLPPWTGILSTLGAVLMCSAGAVGIFAGTPGSRSGREDHRLVRDLGVFTVVLGADDLLQLHEAVVPGVTGLPEEAVLATYAAATALGAVRHRAALRNRITLVPVLAVVLLAASAGLDVLDPGLAQRAWLEDASKILGYTGWTVTLVGWARQASRGAGAGPRPPGSPAA